MLAPHSSPVFFTGRTPCPREFQCGRWRTTEASCNAAARGETQQTPFHHAVSFLARNQRKRERGFPLFANRSPGDTCFFLDWLGSRAVSRRQHAFASVRAARSLAATLIVDSLEVPHGWADKLTAAQCAVSAQRHMHCVRMRSTPYSA